MRPETIILTLSDLTESLPDVLRGGGPWPPPKNTGEARRIVTWRHLRAFAKGVRRVSQFESEEKRAGYPAAFLNYNRALWQWVLEETSDEVLELLNSAQLDAPGIKTADPAKIVAREAIEKHEYLWWRAVYLAGLRAGEGFKLEHTRYLARKLLIAERLNDTSVLEAARQHHYGSTPKAGHEFHRKLKYALLAYWLVLGLWRMASRREQLDALKARAPKGAPRYSPEAFALAQKRLGLKWSPDKT
jgi:hypothetical protein